MEATPALICSVISTVLAEPELAARFTAVHATGTTVVFSFASPEQSAMVDIGETRFMVMTTKQFVTSDADALDEIPERILSSFGR